MAGVMGLTLLSVRSSLPIQQQANELLKGDITLFRKFYTDSFVPNRQRNVIEEQKPLNGATLTAARIDRKKTAEDMRLMFATLGIFDPAMYVSQCQMTEDAKTRYDQIDHAGKRYFIAANLFNSERVLPTLIMNIAEVITTFINSGAYVYISIYENGSTDDTSKWLHAFDYLLSKWKIPHQIRSDPETCAWSDYNRIDMLAELRNRALTPLYENPDPYHTILFYNDIFHCPTDVYELLYQKQIQDADVVCPLDWSFGGDAYNRQRVPSGSFYDSWVARTLSGDSFYPLYSSGWQPQPLENYFIRDPETRNRFQGRLPFQVLSCWNGMTILNARPFYGQRRDDDPLKPTTAAAFPPVRFRSGREGECAASECELVCRDYWKEGYHRVVVVPRIFVTYTLTEHIEVGALWTSLFYTWLQNKDFPPAASELVNYTDTRPTTILCAPDDGIGLSWNVWAHMYREWQVPAETQE